MRTDWQRGPVDRILLEKGSRKRSSFMRGGLRGGRDAIAPTKRDEEEKNK